MITRQFLLDKYKKWGLVIVPLNNDTKIPISKFTGKYDDEGKQIWSWKYSKGITFSDEELLAARRWGIDHEASGTVDADFDDSLLHAHKFIDLLPDTFTIGKKYNGSGIPTANHKLFFKPKDVEIKSESYGKNTDSGCIIELLPNTQSHYFGDRDIINDIPPKRLTESEFQQLRQSAKEIYFLAMASRNYPPKGKKRRDEYIMRVAGVLVQHTDWNTAKREKCLKLLLKANKDTDEIKNRLDKITKQEKKFKEGTKIYGIPALVEFLGADKNDGLDWIDAIKPEENKNTSEENKGKTIIFHNSLEFSKIEFPKPVYILEPYIREQTITALIGETESGKTMTGMRLSGSVANAKPWLDATAVGRPRPTLYIEGDLPAEDIKVREGSMIDYFNKRGWGWNTDYFHLSTLQQQLMVGRDGFTPLQSEQGQLEIENAIKEIAKRTGQRVFVTFDNISCLAPGFEENKAEAWSPLIRYFLKLKSQGHIVHFHHHLNKGKDFSGSTMQVRAIDMAIRFQKLDSKHKIEMSGEKNVQCKVDFDIKWRLHGNSKYAKPFILTCDEQQNWRKKPLLDNNEYEIMRLHNEGYDVEEMKEEIGLAEKTIYKKLKKLRDNGFIDKEVKKDETNRQTVDGKAKEVC